MIRELALGEMSGVLLDPVRHHFAHNRSGVRRGKAAERAQLRERRTRRQHFGGDHDERITGCDARARIAKDIDLQARGRTRGTDADAGNAIGRPAGRDGSPARRRRTAQRAAQPQIHDLIVEGKDVVELAEGQRFSGKICARSPPGTLLMVRRDVGMGHVGSHRIGKEVAERRFAVEHAPDGTFCRDYREASPAAPARVRAPAPSPRRCRRSRSTVCPSYSTAATKSFGAKIRGVNDLPAIAIERQIHAPEGAPSRERLRDRDAVHLVRRSRHACGPATMASTRPRGSAYATWNISAESSHDDRSTGLSKRAQLPPA